MPLWRICWKGGILTIGTFGFDPLIKDQNSGLDDDIEDEDDIQECEISVSDHEDQNPLMYANGHEQLSHETPKANVIMGINDGNTRARRSTDDESDKSSKKERITLADLFSADFPDKKKVQLSDLHVTNKKASKAQVKIGVSFAKKLIPRVREDSRPIQKRQKVHPDMENKNNKNSRVTEAAATMLDLSPVTSESISLLKILEITI